jgi:hypothetical protein
VLPQFDISMRCFPENRPREVTGVIVACDSDTLPTRRSPSPTADAVGSTRDTARTPNGTCPARDPAPAGGANTTTDRASSWGRTSTSGGCSCAQAAASPTTSRRNPSTMLDRFRTRTRTVTWPPGSTVTSGSSTVTTGSTRRSVGR